LTEQRRSNVRAKSATSIFSAARATRPARKSERAKQRLVGKISASIARQRSFVEDQQFLAVGYLIGGGGVGM